MTKNSRRFGRKSNLIIFTIASWLISAGAAQAQEAQAQDPATLGAPDFATVSAVIKQNCIGCHSNGVDKGGVNLETYANVFANRDKIAETVASGKMPKRSVLDEPSKEIILNWIAAGAPEGVSQ